MKMKGATQNGARPCEGNDADVGVVEVGGEVGVGGERRGRGVGIDG